MSHGDWVEKLIEEMNDAMATTVSFTDTAAEPLENVLRAARAYKATCILDPDNGEWLATVNCLTDPPVSKAGVGANPDAAIRDAVANAKEAT